MQTAPRTKEEKRLFTLDYMTRLTPGAETDHPPNKASNDLPRERNAHGRGVVARLLGLCTRSGALGQGGALMLPGVAYGEDVRSANSRMTWEPRRDS
ncbi:hypothetical protein PMIN05_011083 [Paraphaeosphaeria minitans]